MSTKKFKFGAIGSKLGRLAAITQSPIRAIMKTLCYIMGTRRWKCHRKRRNDERPEWLLGIKNWRTSNESVDLCHEGEAIP